jgi:LacI family transcriptional regulator
MARKVSLKDIAQKAGVSTTLVSYVLNNQKVNRINKETAEKIKQVARQLHYRANLVAKSLKTNKTFTIGLVVADISNLFFSTLARIIEDAAEEKNYIVIFGSSDENLEKFSRLTDTFINRQVDGMIIAPPENAEQEIEVLVQQQVPFVLVDRYFPSLKVDYVVLDNKDAARQAVDHLINGGRKKIGMITYRTGLVHLADRKEGYKKALYDHGIEFKEEWCREVEIGNSKAQIEEAVHALLYAPEPVDAIVLASNNIANHAVKYINTLPLKVPRDLALVCFDETESLDLFYAPLSYIEQPLAAMAQEAVRILLDKLDKKEELVQVSMKAKLVPRQSSRPEQES